MDKPQPVRGRIWLDVTTTRHAGAKHDGTTRVERSLIRELPECLPGQVGFCVYDRTLKRFSAVERPAPLAPSAAYKGGSKRRGKLRTASRALERGLRGLVRSASAEIAARLDQLHERSPFPQAAPGDIVLFAGENWSRYDFKALRTLKRRHGVRIAAVLQDVIPHVHPQFFDGADFMRRFRAYVDFLAEDADLVLAISQSTRNDFLRAAPSADPAKAVVIELGYEIGAPKVQSRPAEIARLGDKPFVLSVSTIQVRKNFDLLYRLWQRMAIQGRTDQPHLVIVGREGFGSADLLHQMRNDPWIEHSVTILHHASDAELAWLYAHCAFTLYPSWYEGWGLPLSESLAHGKTFIASNSSSLPEAGQGLGIHLDPYDLAAWQRELLRLSNDAEARSVMEKRILAERRLTSWTDCARAITAAIGQLSIVRK